ncbi:MAG: hypothetical protein ACLU98_05460 [Desulfovibrio fairfieldensis]
MHTILIAGEGKTDFDALHTLVKEIARQHETQCECRPLFPEEDATSGRQRGWSGLMEWCKRHRGDISNPQRAQEDNELLSLAGISRPRQILQSFPPWQFFHAFEPDTRLLFHLDGDIAEEIGSHHPDGQYQPDADRISYCRKALSDWTGLSPEEALWAIPVHCLETWFLTLYSIEECKAFWPDMQDYESTTTELVYDLLCSFGHKAYIDDFGIPTVDKCELTKKYRSSLAQHINKLYSACPSAKDFAVSVQRFFEQDQVETG